MQRFLKKSIGPIFWLILAGCTSAPQGSQPTIPPLAIVKITPTQTILAVDLFRMSNGDGELRSSGYWLIWNTCAENNQSETARANGGREAGWILMDDLLDNPGILVGTLQIASCQQGVNLLNHRNLQKTDMKDDVAYALAAQLLAAQLNLAVGSEYCPASDQAVSKAQLLLLELNFDGMGNYLGPPRSDNNVEIARNLTEQLAEYNSGALCVP